MEVTAEDRAEFPYHTDGAIQGIKIVRSCSNDELMDLADNPSSSGWPLIMQSLGSETNPSWVKARVADELYSRDIIDEQRFDELTRD